MFIASSNHTSGNGNMFLVISDIKCFLDASYNNCLVADKPYALLCTFAKS